MTHEDRHLRMVQDMPRRAAECPFAETVSTVSAHYDQFGLELRGGLENRRTGLLVVHVEIARFELDAMPEQICAHVERWLPCDFKITVASLAAQHDDALGAQEQRQRGMDRA